MNVSELKAMNWLKSQGYSAIVFQQGDSPDFCCSGGWFEVKKPFGKNILSFRNRQLSRIQDKNAKILVFDEISDSPLAILDSKHLYHNALIEGFKITSLEDDSESIHIKLSDKELYWRWKRFRVNFENDQVALLKLLKLVPERPTYFETLATRE